LQYTQINKKLQIELSLCREQRQTAKDMLSIIKTDIKNLQDISPVIDQEIIKEYNLKYGKYKNVKKPNFVNGLTVVKVNANSLEQEMASARSTHSIQSGAPSRAMSVIGDNNQYGGGGGGGGGGSGGGGGGGGGYNNFSNDFRGGGGNAEFPDLNTNFVNLSDVAVNIPFSNFQMNANVNRSSNVSNHSQPNSRTRSPPASSRMQTPAQNLNARPLASAQLVFANASLKTPVSSSPVSVPSILQNNEQEHQKHQNNNAALSRLSTPNLLENFQQPDINSDNGSYVVDIPDANFYTNNNNNDGNSNIILNVDPSAQSSPTGSQFGNM
jgi:hypothetical protein